MKAYHAARFLIGPPCDDSRFGRGRGAHEGVFDVDRAAPFSRRNHRKTAQFAYNAFASGTRRAQSNDAHGKTTVTMDRKISKDS
jgi:hypothetical protein